MEDGAVVEDDGLAPGFEKIKNPVMNYYSFNVTVTHLRQFN